MRGTCDYCKTSFQNMKFSTCPYCAKKLCIYHAKPESHKCPGVDWSVIRQNKYDDSRERFIRYRKKLENRYWMKVWFRLFLLVLLALVLTYFLYPNAILNTIYHKKACNDDTQSGACSSDKPYLCQNGILIYNPSICGCPAGDIINGSVCAIPLNCNDGTHHNFCSVNKPLFCFNGNLISNASLCGCPNGSTRDGENCRQEKDCNDGTRDTQCSTNQPYYCYNGTLTKNTSICGCPAGFEVENESCSNPYMTNEKIELLPFTLNGQYYNLTVPLYGGLNSYLSTQTGNVYYSYNPSPSMHEVDAGIANQMIDQPDQNIFMDNIVNQIENFTSDKQDQARVAISLVQNIPYDWNEFYSNSTLKRYPYQVLYDDKGVCGEKSQLLALLLEKLGFGTGLFFYNDLDPGHEAVGISCPIQYSLDESGYCFVESTSPTIVTDNSEKYLSYNGPITLGQPNDIVNVSNGIVFDSSQEYSDAQEYEFIVNQSTLSSNDYEKLINLVDKYGLQQTSCTGQNETLCNGLCWTSCPNGMSPICSQTGLNCE